MIEVNDLFSIRYDEHLNRFDEIGVINMWTVISHSMISNLTHVTRMVTISVSVNVALARGSCRACTARSSAKSDIEHTTGI